jgi:hypothetical protein
MLFFLVITTYTFDNRSRRSRTEESSTRRTESLSPSALGDHGHDDDYYEDAEFDHEFDREDMELAMRQDLFGNRRRRKYEIDDDHLGGFSTHPSQPLDEYGDFIE